MAKRKTRADIPFASSPWLNLFLICSCLLGVLFFLYGFFPVKYVNREISSFQSLPSLVTDIRVLPKEFYFPRVSQLVFIVVDALRWDFLIKSENIKFIPFIDNLLKSGQACLFYAECNAPTVTMPRIKALMTGSVPNFIDVMLNLGTHRIKGDSLIMQAVGSKKNVIFYGDDTWLKMFPSAFLRSEGTTSFFVSDYEEVDANVTRHIPTELTQSDWDVMILHYLGLDHIGHLAGPFSPLIGPKLREMDRVVEVVIEGLNKSEKNSLSPMLVLIGDHGMRNSGGHGGSTPDEILTSLLFVQPGCKNSKWFKQRVKQIDVTPTLAVLLGLPIPHNSIGTLLSGVLAVLPPLHHLYALHYNAHHLKRIAVISDCFDFESSRLLEDAESTFAQLLKLNFSDRKLYEQGVWLYETSSRGMSECLQHSDSGFHVIEMIAGCSIMFAVIVTLIEILLLGIRRSIQLNTVMLVAVALAVLAAYFFDSPVSVIAVTVTAILTASLSRLWIYPRTPVIMLVKMLKVVSPTLFFYILGCCLHAISLSSSSLVEEEHQTWYFLWTSLSLIKLCSISAHIFMVKSYGKHFTKQAVQMIFLLVAHRFLRTLNQTGDKWADLPDTGDWLRQPENWFLHLLFTITGLCGVWISLRYLNKTNDAFYNSLSAAALFCVLLCRTAIGDLLLPFVYSKSKGLSEANYFWILVLVATVHQIWKERRILETITCFLLLTLSLVLRPHNLVILPFLIFASRILFSVFPSLPQCAMAHAWMGSAAFFYQGNSNSLTSVDVAAGYVGAADHVLIRVGILVFLHTYSAPIISLLLMITGLVHEKHQRQNIYISLQLVSIQKLIPLFVACFICVIHRHHLFVWSVFAPKLLYEVMSFFAVFLLVTPMWIVLLFSSSYCAKRDK